MNSKLKIVSLQSYHIFYMATTYLEFLHISEFYQTIMFLIIIIPMFMQILLFKNQLWIYINLKRVEQQQQDQKYLADNQLQQSSELQKQIESIQSQSRRETQGKVQNNQQNNHNQTVQPMQNENKEQINIEKHQHQQEQSRTKKSMIKMEQPPLTSPMNPNQDMHQKPQLTFDQTRVMYFYEQVVDVYQKYLPMIFVIVVMGILTGCCEVFSLAMFFCYVISTFLLDYAEMFQKLKKEYQSNTVAPYVHLVSSCFMLAIFINLFSRNEYSLV